MTSASPERASRPGSPPPDASLRRIERNALSACLGMAIVALVLQHGRLDGALGVLGGGALIGLSYSAIRGGVDALVEASASQGARGPSEAAGEEGLVDEARAQGGVRAWRPSPWVVVKFFLRYALLAAGAYVMLMLLHLHPVGLVAGVSSIFIGMFVEAVRLVRSSRGPGKSG
jgi:hypothetical protein